MAWNEPGGSGKDKDPWGGGSGGDNQGPPDLDEVVKKMQDKFGALFGGGGGSGRAKGGGGGGGISSAGIGLILVVLAAVWGVMGFYTVDEGKRAVVLQFGKYEKTTMPGLQWIPPIIQSYERRVFNQVQQRAGLDQWVIACSLLESALPARTETRELAGEPRLLGVCTAQFIHYEAIV